MQFFLLGSKVHEATKLKIIWWHILCVSKFTWHFLTLKIPKNIIPSWKKNIIKTLLKNLRLTGRHKILKSHTKSMMTNPGKPYYCGQMPHPAGKCNGAQRPLCPSRASPPPMGTSVSIYSPLAKMWESIMSPSLLTLPSTMTVVGNLVAITTGTSLMSAQSHLLFFLFSFWFCEKFFSSEKKMSWPLAAGFFSLLSINMAFSTLLSLVAWLRNWSLLNVYDLRHFLSHTELADVKLHCQGPHGLMGSWSMRSCSLVTMLASRAPLLLLCIFLLELISSGIRRPSADIKSL